MEKKDKEKEKKRLAKIRIREVRNKEKKKRIPMSKKRKNLVFISIALLMLLIVFFVIMGYFSALIVMTALLVIAVVYFLVRKSMKRFADIKKMEEAFPDFISLMSSNLRAGITVDKALLLSSRKEFAPLDKEISNLGKDIMTGREINKALVDMSDRIGSEEIRKTVMLIVSGIRSGGNLSVLLEQVSSNMRERTFVRKRAASNVLMYVIFIFFAVAFGAPILFGLSSVLVGILTDIVASVPSEQVTNVNVPFALSKVNISVNFVLYFSLIFIIVTDVLSSLVLGLVSKGRERDGVKFILPLVLTSVTVFFAARLVVLKYFPSFLG